MELNNIEHITYGLIYGLTEILPVSSQAHSILLLKVVGASRKIHGLPMLLIHAAILTALLLLNQSQLKKMFRARRLALIPKQKRKRPLDVHSLLDLHFWYTAMIPVVIVLLFFSRISALSLSMPILSILMTINGIMLYVPQYLPGSNKDARTLTRAEGLLVGLGSAIGAIPGISAIGGAASLGSVNGVDRNYALTVAELLELVWLSGLLIYDFADIITYGFGLISVQILFVYLIAACAAYAGARVADRILHKLAQGVGYYPAAFYCWGIALFTFILNLLA